MLHARKRHFLVVTVASARDHHRGKVLLKQLGDTCNVLRIVWADYAQLPGTRETIVLIVMIRRMFG